METDTQGPSRRPRPWLLILLGIAVLALIANRMWPGDSATVRTPASNQARNARARSQADRFDPAELKVRLDRLEASQPGPADVERNPFRFRPKAAPPPLPGGNRASTPSPSPVPQPVGPPPGPEIPLKFMGLIEKGGLGKVAALSDCKGFTANAREGDIIDGRYRLVTIGVESVVIEFVNGTGRTTLRLSGCPAR